MWKHLTFVVLIGFSSTALAAQDIEFTLFDDVETDVEAESTEYESTDDTSMRCVFLTKEVFGGEIHEIFQAHVVFYCGGLAFTR